MDTLCRTCIEQVTNFTSLSSKIESSSNKSYFDFLNKCSTLNARESDGLPQILCSICANAMKTFYSFMKLAENSDLILREALRKLTAEGRYNGRREIPCGEVAIPTKNKERSEDFNQGDSFHCQPTKNSTGKILYSLDIVKEEPREFESISIVDVRGAESNASEKLESDLHRRATSIDTKHNDSDDDVPISLLKSRLVKNEDGADSQSNSLSEAYCTPSNAQSKIGKPEAKSKEVVKEGPPSVHGAGGLIVIDKNGISCEETTVRSVKVEEASFHCQPRNSSTELSPYILDFVKEEPCLSESTSIVAVNDAEIDEDRLLANIETEYTDSEDDESISSLKRSLDKYEDETDPESTSCEEITERNETILHGCEICGKKFHTKSNLKDHLDSHEGIRPKCDQCGMDFRNMYTLSRHMKWHANPKPFKCENCGRSFCRKDRCTKHTVICKLQTKPEKLKIPELKKPETDCGICGKKFSRKDYLDIHMQVHMGIIPKCNICGKVFEHGYCLNKHMKMHTNPKRFNCEVCGKSLSSFHSRHKETCKRPGEPLTIFDCEICGKQFTSKYYLRTHMDSHNGVTRKCDQCGKIFKHGLSFTRHLRWHKNPRPFTCEYCGKSLARKSSYDKHKKICKLADKEQQLKTQPIHSEPKKQVLLPAMLFQKDALPRKQKDKQFRKNLESLNLESHNGIINQCGKEFQTSLSLRSHMEEHTNPQSYKCENCGELFAGKCTYARHVDICKGPHQPKATYLDSGHKDIHKPKDNTIRDTVKTEDSNLHWRGNNDIKVEVT